MAVDGIHHLGVAVTDLDQAVATYEKLLGASVEAREWLPDQGVEAVLLRVGGSRVELLAATGPDTPLGRFLSSRGPGMHHVAYQVDDLAATLRGLEEAGVELVDREPRRGLAGLPVAFLHPSAAHGVLCELVGRGG